MVDLRNKGALIKRKVFSVLLCGFSLTFPLWRWKVFQANLTSLEKGFIFHSLFAGKIMKQALNKVMLSGI